MKKQIITLIFIFLGLTTFAQQFKPDPNFTAGADAPNAKRFIVDTVATSTYKKEQLYSNALGYLTNAAKDSRNLIESKSIELGEIVFSGNIETSVLKSDTTKKGKIETYKKNVKVFFKCNVYVKDQKFKIILSKIETELSGLGLEPWPIDPLPNGIENRFHPLENKAACELTLYYVKLLADKINSKPQRDF